MGVHSELAELSATEIGRKLARGELTSAELVQMSMERIAAVDAGLTRSVIEVNPDALDIARRRDAERRRGQPEVRSMACRCWSRTTSTPAITC